MTSRGPGILILGAGTVGCVAALALREAGYDGRVTLIGSEAVVPYNRPSLSKEYLRGEEGFDVLRVASEEELRSLEIELRCDCTATRIDPTGHVVEVDGRERIPYAKLLVATGGRNRRLRVPGVDLEGVCGLRTVSAADRIRAAVRPGCQVVIVGMGFIGSEVAASLRMLGAHVSAIEAGPAPMASVLGETVGQVLAGIHSERGVRLLLNDAVEAFEGDGRVERVRTRAGHDVECELAVVGIGIEPNVELIRDAGAQVGRGVIIDELCRTTLADVYAAGDVAEIRHPVFGTVQVEHWNNAVMQGRAAALSMIGRGTPYDYLYSFWSDQYEHSLEYLGHATQWDRTVIRGSLQSRRFLAFYLQDDHLLAVAGLNRGGNPEDRIRGSELKKCIPLVRERAVVEPSVLEDEDCSLLSAARQS